MPETPVAGVAPPSQPADETRRENSGLSPEIEALTQDLASLSPAGAKRRLLKLKMEGALTLEQLDAIFALMPTLRSA